MKVFRPLFCGIALALAVSGPSAAAGEAPGAVQPSEDIARPVRAMFQAMRDRNVEALDQTLARTTEPQIVYYWGDTVSGRDAILPWHKEWFAEKGWSLAPETFGHSLTGDKLATVTSTVEYIKSPVRKFVILSTATLVREPSGWKVARIQQTLLTGPE